VSLRDIEATYIYIYIYGRCVYPSGVFLVMKPKVDLATSFCRSKHDTVALASSFSVVAFPIRLTDTRHVCCRLWP
jgi:hypothetical protein